MPVKCSLFVRPPIFPAGLPHTRQSSPWLDFLHHLWMIFPARKTPRAVGFPTCSVIFQSFPRVFRIFFGDFLHIITIPYGFLLGAPGNPTWAQNLSGSEKWRFQLVPLGKRRFRWVKYCNLPIYIDYVYNIYIYLYTYMCTYVYTYCTIVYIYTECKRNIYIHTYIYICMYILINYICRAMGFTAKMLVSWLPIFWELAMLGF